MAKSKVAGRRAAAQQIPLTPLAQASLDAQALYCNLDGIKRLAEFLGDIQHGSTSLSIPDATKEWLRPILYDWIRDTAADLEGRADRVLRKVLDEQSKTAVA